MDISKLNRDELTLLGAGGCAMAALHFSSQLASQHLYYWKNPKEQSAILMIILMVPVFAVYSFVGVLDLKGAKNFLMVLTLIKECYEALVVAKFLDLLFGFLNLDISENVVPDEFKGREIRHVFPFSLLQVHTAYLNNQTLKLLKYRIWQFVITRPVCSLLVMGLQLVGVYPVWVNWTFKIIVNVSICMAMYSLLLFYRVFAKELKPHKVIAKFSCIVGVICFCFWQGVFLEFLVKSGFINSHHFWLDVENVGEAIQNILICVEMLGVSVFQQYAFHFERYSGDVQTMLKKGKRNE